MTRPARRVLVTGSRDWTDDEAVRSALDGQWAAGAGLVVVHGGCPTGADAIAGRWAESSGATAELHPADWGLHGRAAGPIRNQAMVDAGVDICLAFPLLGSGGTWDCVRRAEAAGIEIRIHVGRSEGRPGRRVTPEAHRRLSVAPRRPGGRVGGYAGTALNQSVVRIHDRYAAIGSGGELATGYLAAVTGLPTVEFTGSVMRRALVDAVHVACQYDPGCSVDPRRLSPPPGR